jgi:hypothetical protein
VPGLYFGLGRSLGQWGSGRSSPIARALQNYTTSWLRARQQGQERAAKENYTRMTQAAKQLEAQKKADVERYKILFIQFAGKPQELENAIRQAAQSQSPTDTKILDILNSRGILGVQELIQMWDAKGGDARAGNRAVTQAEKDEQKWNELRDPDQQVTPEGLPNRQRPAYLPPVKQPQATPPAPFTGGGVKPPTLPGGVIAPDSGAEGGGEGTGTGAQGAALTPPTQVAQAEPPAAEAQARDPRDPGLSLPQGFRWEPDEQAPSAPGQPPSPSTQPPAQPEQSAPPAPVPQRPQAEARAEEPQRPYQRPLSPALHEAQERFRAGNNGLVQIEQWAWQDITGKYKASSNAQINRIVRMRSAEIRNELANVARNQQGQAVIDAARQINPALGDEDDRLVNRNGKPDPTLMRGVLGNIIRGLGDRVNPRFSETLDTSANVIRYYQTGRGKGELEKIREQLMDLYRYRDALPKAPGVLGRTWLFGDPGQESKMDTLKSAIIENIKGAAEKTEARKNLEWRWTSPTVVNDAVNARIQELRGELNEKREDLAGQSLMSPDAIPLMKDPDPQHARIPELLQRHQNHPDSNVRGALDILRQDPNHPRRQEILDKLRRMGVQ